MNTCNWATAAARSLRLRMMGTVAASVRSREKRTHPLDPQTTYELPASNCPLFDLASTYRKRVFCKSNGKTWGVRGQTPVVQRPGQRQSISAASAVNAKGAFWFSTYEGGLNAELFVELLKKNGCKGSTLALGGAPHKAEVRTFITTCATLRRSIHTY